MNNNEDPISILAKSLSEFAGRLSAMDATLRGILATFSDSPELIAAVFSELEKEYANHLQVSQNKVFIEEFEAQADSIRAALSKQVKD